MLLLSSVWYGAARRSAAQSRRGGNVEEGDITRLTQSSQLQNINIQFQLLGELNILMNIPSGNPQQG